METNQKRQHYWKSASERFGTNWKNIGQDKIKL